MLLGKLLDLSEPQFPDLKKNENEHGPVLTGLWVQKNFGMCEALNKTEGLSLSPWRRTCGMKFRQIQSDRAGHQRESDHSVDRARRPAGDRPASAGWDGAGPLRGIRGPNLLSLLREASLRLLLAQTV